MTEIPDDTLTFQEVEILFPGALRKLAKFIHPLGVYDTKYGFFYNDLEIQFNSELNGHVNTSAWLVFYVNNQGTLTASSPHYVHGYEDIDFQYDTRGAWHRLNK
jgi:hypothetical protein